MARATSSLPVPLSPRTRTVESVGATRSMRRSTSVASRVFAVRMPPKGAALGVHGRAARRCCRRSCRLLRRLPHHDVQLLDLGRLGQVVVGAELHRLHRGGHVLEAGHHDHLRRLRHLLPARAGRRCPRLLRHAHVEQRRRRTTPRECARARWRRRPLRPPRVRAGASSRMISSRRFRSSSATSTRIGARHERQPPRGRCCAHGTEPRESRPRSVRRGRSTMPCAIASPRPVPCPGGLVVKKGWKMRARFSSGIPGPSSSSSISTEPCARRASESSACPGPPSPRARWTRARGTPGAAAPRSPRPAAARGRGRSPTWLAAKRDWCAEQLDAP